MTSRAVVTLMGIACLVALLVQSNLVFSQSSSALRDRDAIKTKDMQAEFRQVIEMAEIFMVVHKVDASDDLKTEVLKMKAFSQFDLHDLRGAEESVREILNINPNFKTDPDIDPPDKAAFVQRIKDEPATIGHENMPVEKEIGQTPPEIVVPEDTTTVPIYKKPWVWIVGAAVVGGAAYYFLKPDGDEHVTPQQLPTHPARPTN
jgi:hypothetical protein